MRLVAIFVLTFALFAIPSQASAEPKISVKPERANCQQPFEITATGLAPLKPIEVMLTTAGQVATGGVGGTSDADGVFISPFPMINVPCDFGGVVTATIRVDGELLDASVTFVVIGRNATPTAPRNRQRSGSSDSARLDVRRGNRSRGGVVHHRGVDAWTSA